MGRDTEGTEKYFQLSFCAICTAITAVYDEDLIASHKNALLNETVTNSAAIQPGVRLLLFRETFR